MVKENILTREDYDETKRILSLGLLCVICFMSESCVNGPGTSIGSGGNKYGGVLKGDMRNDQGTLTYPDGSKYTGEFKDDKMNGQGTLTCPDGTVKSGTWKDSKLDNQ